MLSVIKSMYVNVITKQIKYKKINEQYIKYKKIKILCDGVCGHS